MPVIKSHCYFPDKLWEKLKEYMKKNNLGWNSAVNSILDQALDEKGNLQVKER